MHAFHLIVINTRMKPTNICSLIIKNRTKNACLLFLIHDKTHEQRSLYISMLSFPAFAATPLPPRARHFHPLTLRSMGQSFFGVREKTPAFCFLFIKKP